MRVFAISCREILRVLFVAAFALAALSTPGFASEEGEEGEKNIRFEGEATLGTNLYIITPPFDTSNVSGFFNQWRYIRDQGGSPPFFVDLLHADLGLRRPDDTWLARVERWSFNSLNEHGLFDLDWKGLSIDGQWRRYRGDYLRNFPGQTDSSPIGDPGCCFATTYTPDTPNDALFDQNRRFWIRRQQVGGTASFRPGDFGWKVPVLTQLDVLGGYETRTGYRQDSLCFECEPGSRTSAEGYRGLRRPVDQTITTVGGGLVFDPLGFLTGALGFDYQAFREDAPIATESTFWGGNQALDFVPDTNRFTGRIDLSRRIGAASLEGGATLTHLAQTGRKTPDQVARNLADNTNTSYSVWTAFDWPVTPKWDVTGFAKWFYRKNGVDQQALEPRETSFLGQGSPYIRQLGQLRANAEFGYQPIRGSRAALGYRANYAHRRLRYAPFGIQPDESLIRPDSLHHIFYLSGRMRARSLRLRAEVGYDWGPETAYPNEFSKAVYVEGRGSYTFPTSTPITLAVSGRFEDGKAPGFEVQAANSQIKEYKRTAWNYDVTLTTVPVRNLVVFATYNQWHDDQAFNHVRSQFARFDDPGLLNLFFIDSDQRYTSDVYSFTIGGSHPLGGLVDLSTAVSLTFTRANFSEGSQTGRLLEANNEIRNRIVTFELDAEREVFPAVTLGMGYRLQAFDDTAPVRYLDYTETVHTFTVRVGVDFDELFR